MHVNKTKGVDMKKLLTPVLGLVLSTGILIGCTATQVGTTTGAAAGAGLGYAVSGGSGAGAIVGAGAGSLLGYTIGRDQDRRRYYRGYYY